MSRRGSTIPSRCWPRWPVVIPRELAPLLGNDLQPAALSLDPGLRRTLRAGVEAGALAGIVSGSGPTCAFLCESAAAALDVGTELAGAGVCRTVRVASGPVHGARVVPGCLNRRTPKRPPSVTRPSITTKTWQLLKGSLR